MNEVTPLKIAIVRSGKTSDSVARSIGVTPAALSRWARGHRMPRADYASMLASELDTTVEELFPAKPSNPEQVAA